MKQTLLCTILLCLLIGTVHAQNNSVTAWNNKQFTVGDTIVIGEKAYDSWYKSLQEVNQLNNRITAVSDTIVYQKAIVKSIVSFDSKFYAAFAIRENFEEFPLITIESENRTFIMNVNVAVYYDEVAEHDVGSELQKVEALTRATLFYYNLKVHKKIITDSVVLEYIDQVDKELKNNFKDNPFARKRYIQQYRAELETKLSEIDFKKLFRVTMTSELSEYDIEKQQFPIQNLECPAADYRHSYYGKPEKPFKFGLNNVIFANLVEFKNTHWDVDKAEGFYNMVEMVASKYPYTFTRKRKLQFNVYFMLDQYLRRGALNFKDFGSIEKYSIEATKTVTANVLYMESFFLSKKQKENELVRYNFMCGLKSEQFDETNK